jgi:hypothetical protein
MAVLWKSERIKNFDDVLTYLFAMAKKQEGRPLKKKG